jgi:hypothetical protein
MSAKTHPKRCLTSLFSQQPCWQIEPLAVEMNYSIPSVRRFLRTTGYYSSFTHNGTWYTLHSIPRFSREGLWFYQEIGFSRAGTLTDTLINLTSRSPAGMTAEALGEKLHCRCHGILVQLCREGRMQRVKAGRSYVYLAPDHRTAIAQRQAMAKKEQPAQPLPASIAVWVLVTFIQNPQSDFKELTRILSKKQHITVKESQIEKLFDQYALKKTT